MSTSQQVSTDGSQSASDGLQSNPNPLIVMLVIAYATNYMDRTIVGTLAQAIKLDLKINDAQLGLLQGFAFVAVYAIMGIPIARMSERFDRVSIISICMAVWSGMTMLCGFAANFGQLVTLRMCVGIGEAGCNAPAHSMVADAFPPAQRARAIGIYNLGVPIGTMIGAVSGGLIAQYLSWRMAFLIVGAPGFVLAIIMRTTVREPRRIVPQQTVVATPSPKSVTARSLAWRLASEPALRHLLLGFTLTSFATAGIIAFTQPYFIRAFGLTYAEIGVIFGLTGGAVVAASLLLSGRLADAFVKRDVRWHAWLPAAGVAISTPLSAFGFMTPSWPLALTFTMLGSLFLNWYIAPTQSAIHKIVGVRSVAMVMALVLMFQNLVGLGGGPLFGGIAIDAFAARLFPLAGEFGQMCPAGVGQGALAAPCAETLVLATRYGLMMVISVKLWAILHFLLAARHLKAALAGRNEHQ